jgi:hypothetical protein
MLMAGGAASVKALEVISQGTFEKLFTHHESSVRQGILGVFVSMMNHGSIEERSQRLVYLPRYVIYRHHDLVCAGSNAYGYMNSDASIEDVLKDEDWETRRLGCQLLHTLWIVENQPHLKEYDSKREAYSSVQAWPVFYRCKADALLINSASLSTYQLLPHQTC